MPLSLRARQSTPFEFTLPILTKEMRSRMRGVRAVFLLFVATALAIFLGLLIIITQCSDLGGDIGQSAVAFARVGKGLMLGLMALEMLLCIFITPALTAGAFSIEQEQQTLEMLLLTPLSGRNIVLAKLYSALSFIVVILLCAIPVAAISFAFGGVNPEQLLWAVALIMAQSVCFGMIGLFCSVRFLKTSIASVVSYCISLGWVLLMPVLVLLLRMYHNYSGEQNAEFAVILASLLLLVLATVPTIYTSLLLQLIRRRRLARATNIALWGAFASVACLLLYLPGALDIMNTDYWLFANPAVSMYMVLTGASPNSEVQDIQTALQQTSSISADLFSLLSVLATIGLLLLGAWGAYRLTLRELHRLRRQIA